MVSKKQLLRSNSAARQPIQLAMKAQLHLPALDISWVLLSRACSIVALQLNSKTIRPSMRAKLHLPALDLSWALSDDPEEVGRCGRAGRGGGGGVAKNCT